MRDLAKRAPDACRVDLLVALRSIWGASITVKRDMLYRLVSGNISDRELHTYLKYFYLRYPAFANFVDNAYYFGDTEVPFVQRVLGPARDRVQKYYEECVVSAGSSIIGLDSDYLYLYRAVNMEGCEKVNA